MDAITGSLIRPTSPFLGSAVIDDIDKLDATFAVVGIPHGSPYQMSGVHSDAANAPRIFRERVNARFAGHADRHDFDLGGTLFGETNCTLVDVGDVDADPRDLHGSSVAATEVVKSMLQRGTIPIILGGDDSVPIICARAYESENPVINVLQIDAHIDFRDNVNGVKDGYSSPIRRMAEMPWVGQIVQVGSRATGSARGDDVVDARRAGNVIITADEVHRQGAEVVFSAMNADLPWFVTFDVDGLDPTIAPGTSCPLPGGLDFRQASEILNEVGRRFGLAGIDVVEHFPSLDLRDMTSLTLGRLLISLIGNAARKESEDS
ncbi:arginase family protein [Rhodococcus sp. NPDC055024]